MLPDPSTSNEEMEAFSIEIIWKNSKNSLIGTQYSDLQVKVRYLKNTSKNTLTKPKQEITNLYYHQVEFKSTWPQC